MSRITRSQVFVFAGAMLVAQLACPQQKTQRSVTKVSAPPASQPQAPSREKIATQKLMRNPWEKQRTAARSP